MSICNSNKLFSALLVPENPFFFRACGALDDCRSPVSQRGPSISPLFKATGPRFSTSQADYSRTCTINGKQNYKFYSIMNNHDYNANSRQYKSWNAMNIIFQSAVACREHTNELQVPESTKLSAYSGTEVPKGYFSL